MVSGCVQHQCVPVGGAVKVEVGGVRREGEEKIEEETNREELERLMTTVRGVTRAHDWMWVVEQAKAAGSTEAQNDHLKFSRDVAYSKCLQP